jgi:hypothetical protein
MHKPRHAAFHALLSNERGMERAQLHSFNRASIVACHIIRSYPASVKTTFQKLL